MLGIGAGWYREEFEAVGEDFDERGRRMDEIIDILLRLWSGETFSHAGDFYEFGEVCFGPAVSPPIPVVVGGDSPPALRRAARVGDAWYSTGIGDLGAMIAARDRIESLRAEAGRGRVRSTTTSGSPATWTPPMRSATAMPASSI